MLLLSRKTGETIVIGSGVTVTVLSVQGGRVKLGIAAPAEVPVHRKEIFAKLEGALPSLPTAQCV